MTKRQYIGFSLILISVLVLVVIGLNNFITPLFPSKISNFASVFTATFLAIIGGVASFKDTLELIQALKRKTNPPQYIKMHDPQDLTNIEEFETVLGIHRIPATKFVSVRFDAYKNIWNYLQRLKRAGDNLWARVTPGNVADFGQLLVSVRAAVNEDAIFFDNRDYKQLKMIINSYEKYVTGKAELVLVMNLLHLKKGEVNEGVKKKFAMIRERVKENKKLKDSYENLLEQIRLSFHRRLSA